MYGVHSSTLKSNLSVPSTDNNNQYTKTTVTPSTPYVVIEHLLHPERNINEILIYKIAP